MGTHRGTHGTTAQRADGIEAEGFGPTRVGRAGTGVYLWAYADDRSNARELALGWYAFQQKRGVFSGETDPKWAVLYAEIDAAPEDCFDCNTVEFRELLVAWLRGLGRRDNEPYTEDDICTAYNALVARIESKVDREFCVVHACVPLPKMSFKEKVVGSDAFIHLIRREYDQLKITGRETEPPSEQVEAQEPAAVDR